MKAFKTLVKKEEPSEPSASLPAILQGIGKNMIFTKVETNYVIDDDEGKFKMGLAKLGGNTLPEVKEDEPAVTMRSLKDGNL